jgi:predicted nucleic acid-binding protein
VSRWTIDASVAVKWFVPEIHSEAAAAWLQDGFELMAPDLLFSEIGNILWKKVRRSELQPGELDAVCRNIGELPFRIWPAKELFRVALDLALVVNRSVDDCTYLAVALAFDAPLVTADRKLFEALSAGAFAGTVRWLEERP